MSHRVAVKKFSLSLDGSDSDAHAPKHYKRFFYKKVPSDVNIPGNVTLPAFRPW
jgi:hypothetical protein